MVVVDDPFRKGADRGGIAAPRGGANRKRLAVAGKTRAASTIEPPAIHVATIAFAPLRDYLAPVLETLGRVSAVRGPVWQRNVAHPLAVFRRS